MSSFLFVLFFNLKYVGIAQREREREREREKHRERHTQRDRERQRNRQRQSLTPSLREKGGEGELMSYRSNIHCIVLSKRMCDIICVMVQNMNQFTSGSV